MFGKEGTSLAHGAPHTPERKYHKAIPFVERDTAKVVGIWIRVSTEDQARGESPEHHEKRARHYAELRGWEVVEVYHLEGVSGKAVMQHPEAKRMLEDVKSGHITSRIFSKLARLARKEKAPDFRTRR